MGRYIILGKLGSGGMGIVYSAFDPDLDRKIALKVLRSEAYGGGEIRLKREAQSLARLKHPNVVTVYDVGIYEDQVFIAMEMIEGWPLSGWLDEASRGWREILDAYMAAGRGMSAAHAVGLVHRDIKPDNILMGRDGVPRVADFGLARLAGETPSQDGDLSPSGRPRSPLDESVTRPGAIMGTPRYMAPEQAAGDLSDARSDQFSFCVALYESLYGKHPYDLSSAEALREGIRTHSVRPPPKGSVVPGWVREALLGGLRHEPAMRYPSMDALLVALGRDPAPRRRRLAIGAGAALALGGIAFGLVKLRTHEVCTGAASELAGVWDGERARGIGAAFQKTGSPLAGAMASAVSLQLDGYAKAFMDMHVEACRATQVRGEQTEVTEELRMSCLADRRIELRALTNLFLSADEEVVRNAVTATQALPSVAMCGDVTTLKAVAEPADPGVRKQIAALRTRLADAEALQNAGKYKKVAPDIEILVTDAQALGWKPLYAEALALRGRNLDRLGSYKEAAAMIEQSLWISEAAHDNHAVLRDALQLMSVNYRQSAFDEGHRWERLATAKLEGGQGDELLASSLQSASSALAEGEGKYDEALSHAEKALSIRQRLQAPDSMELGDVLAELGLAKSNLGKPAEAYADYEKAEHVWEKSLGPDHPQIAMAYGAMGNAEYDQGHFPQAIALQDKAIAIRERVFGPFHPLIGSACSNAGIAADSLHEYDLALAYYQRALLAYASAYPPDHPSVLAGRNNIGSLYITTGRWDEARVELEEVLRLKEAKMGADHPDLVETLENLAEVELHSGHVDVASKYSERAVAIAVVKLELPRHEIGVTHAQLAKIRAVQGKLDQAEAMNKQAIDELTRTGEGSWAELIVPLESLAQLYTDRGAPTLAVPLLEHALELYVKTESPGSAAIAKGKFALAKALWGAHERARAEALLGEARGELTAAHDQTLADLDKWSAARAR